VQGCGESLASESSIMLGGRLGLISLNCKSGEILCSKRFYRLIVPCYDGIATTSLLADIRAGLAAIHIRRSFRGAKRAGSWRCEARDLELAPNFRLLADADALP